MNESLSLKELILYCTDPANKNWEKAWIVFFRRYKEKLYFYIKGACLRWNIPRLNIQIEDVIDDILCETTVLIYKNLKNFKNTDQEIKFYAWLQIICERTTSRFIQRIFSRTILNLDINEIQVYKSSLQDEMVWVIYENTVEFLRDLLKHNKNCERDIHIFLLHIWSGFLPGQINSHPCYEKYAPNAIDVILSRIRKKILNLDMV